MPLAVWILAFTLAAIPPLSPEQRGQLQTAADGRATIDEGALYPLLYNAQQWGPNEELGARVPDFDRIEQSPAEARGELFLVEGVLAKWDAPPRWFSRGGSWDGRMQRWIVAVGPRRDRYVVVYLVAPGEGVDRLRRGQGVRLAARFYKVWFDVDAGDKARTYLAFVGRDARIDLAGPQRSPFPVTMPVAFLIAVAGIGWVVYRLTRVRHSPGARGEEMEILGPSARDDAAHSPDAAPEDEGPPLPKDPASALDELSRRAADDSKSQSPPPRP